MDRPMIATALPQRRYQIGDYSAVVLGDVESADDHDYRFVLAVVPVHASEPILYVTAEQVAQGPDDAPATIARVIAEGGERALGPDERWREMDAFVADALEMVRRVLGLGEEEAMRLL